MNNNYINESLLLFNKCINLSTATNVHIGKLFTF